jgi:phosphatidylglycerol:prolipoprotein diacylglycerol transferase
MYGVWMLAALIAAIGVFLTRARTYGVPFRTAYGFVAAVAAGAWAGAQLAGTLTFLITHDAWTVPLLAGGTGASWGGIAGGLVAARVSRHGRAAPHALVCAAVPAIPIAQAFGRIACFCAGCDYGAPTHMPWAYRYASAPSLPADLIGVPLHPVQLYEAAACALIAIILLGSVRGPCTAARGVASYLTLYASARFVLEWFRGDLDRGLLFDQRVSLAQVLCLGALGWVALRKLRVKSTPALAHG